MKTENEELKPTSQQTQDIKQVVELMPDDEIFKKREKEVMHLVLKGNSAKMISDVLGISIYTVYGYFKTLKDKSNTHSITGLMAYAIKNLALFIIDDDISDENPTEPK